MLMDLVFFLTLYPSQPMMDTSLAHTLGQSSPILFRGLTVR